MKYLKRHLKSFLAVALISLLLGAYSSSADSVTNLWYKNGSGSMATNLGNGLANGDIHVAHCYIGLGIGTPCGSSATGTVTSVGLALPSIFTVSGSPVTTTGTLTGTFNTQTANTVFAGPTTGSAATPTFRALTNADISGASIPINHLLAATGSNNIDNGLNQQTWHWDNLVSGGLYLYANSTAATSSAQTLLTGELLGANAQTNQTTRTAKFTNAHTGTSSTNIAGYFSASGGTNNYAAIFDQGFVGIGTQTPSYIFQVRTGADHNFDFNDAGGGGAHMFGLNDAANAYVPLIIDGNPLILNNYSGGLVGIGTLSPSVDLDISKSTAGQVAAWVQNTNNAYGTQVTSHAHNSYLSMYNTGDNAGFASGITANTSFLLSATTGGLAIVEQSAGVPIRFLNGGAANSNEVMRIAATTNNVGIGTATPGSTLQVVSSSTAGAQFGDGTRYASFGANGNAVFYGSTSASLPIAIGNSNGAMAVWPSTGIVLGKAYPWTDPGSGNVSIPNGNLLFTDNTYDIGASGATRPRTGYFGTKLTAPILNVTSAGSGVLNFAETTLNTSNPGISVSTALGTLTTVFSSTGVRLRGADGQYGFGTSVVTDATDTGIGRSAAGNINITNGSSTNYWTIGSSGILASTDNTYDIGASGATRPRNVYIAGTVTLGTSSVNSVLSNTGNGRLMTDGSLFQIAGSTSSFPAIKRSGATIAIRLADDSADADISAARVISSNVVRLKNYTVATLPTGTQGDTAYVTDALAPTFLSVVVGGGSVVTPVFFNGTAWVGY